MNSSRKAVWIIDDEVDLCLLMKSYFLRKNYEVRIFHTCKDVLISLERDIPDYVFIDTNICDNPDQITNAIKNANPDVHIHVNGSGEKKGKTKSKNS
jgi:DNA-binding NtrC family response regulator